MVKRILFLTLIALLLFPDCRKKNDDPPINIGSNSPYTGRWMGIFEIHYLYRDPPDYNTPQKSSTRSFTVNLTLESFGPLINNVAIMQIVHAEIHEVHDSVFFDCGMGGCTPQFPSLATLPYPPENLNTKAGMGFTVIFPNESTLWTNSNIGALYMGMYPGIVSNSLDPNIQPQNTWNNTVWGALDGNGLCYESFLMGWQDTTTCLFFKCTSAKWELTHTTL